MSWLEVASAGIATISALAALPGLTRRARLARRLRLTLELIQSMADVPGLDTMREVLLQKARRTGNHLQRLETAALDHPAQTRLVAALLGTGMAISGGVILLLAEAVWNRPNGWLTYVLDYWPDGSYWVVPTVYFGIVLIYAGILLRWRVVKAPRNPVLEDA